MTNIKVYIIVGLIIIAVLLTVFFVGKYKGKQYTPDTVALPPDTQGVSVPSNWNPGTITDALYDDMNSVMSFHSSTPYTDALDLSNTQLTAVHNDWNQRYFQKFDKQTLRQAIGNEHSVWNYAWDNARTNLSDRLKTLEL